MKLTEEQLIAVEVLGNASVDARPGSGKTRVATAKATRSARELAGSPRRVACITFTNAAVDEMVRRIAECAEAEEASQIDLFTIHSFCLNQIFRPYHWSHPDYKCGYELVAGDDERARELMRWLLGQHRLRLKSSEIDLLANCPVGIDGHPLEANESKARLVAEYWNEFRARRWIDFSLLLFESMRILDLRPEVAQSLSAKYEHVIVDEFQDTTAVQLAVLSRMVKAGSSSFFVVGDINQSIYRFAGADTASSARFVQSIGVERSLPLSGNFRSSERIVRSAEGLVPCAPPMTAIGGNAQVDWDVEIYDSATPPSAVVDQFIRRALDRGCALGDCAVLTAWWTDLLPIARHCAASGIAVVGPGARPYKRGRLIVPILENLAAAADRAIGINSTQRAILRSVEELEGCDLGPLRGWAGRKIALFLRAEARSLASATRDPLEWIASVGGLLDRVLDENQVLRKDAGRLLGSAEEVISDLRSSNRVDVGKLSLSDLAIFADPRDALKLMTIHSAKGREFDAVAIVGANEGRFPHFTAKEQAAFEDGRRALYVGITRAKRLLHVVIDTSDYRNRESRFVASLR